MSDIKPKRCWPWSHQWSKWEDSGSLNKLSPLTKGILDIGVEQRRRCIHCNKLNLRIEWAKK